MEKKNTSKQLITYLLKREPVTPRAKTLQERLKHILFTRGTSQNHYFSNIVEHFKIIIGSKNEQYITNVIRQMIIPQIKFKGKFSAFNNQGETSTSKGSYTGIFFPTVKPTNIMNYNLEEFIVVTADMKFKDIAEVIYLRKRLPLLIYEVINFTSPEQFTLLIKKISSICRRDIVVVGHYLEEWNSNLKHDFVRVIFDLSQLSDPFKQKYQYLNFRNLYFYEKLIGNHLSLTSLKYNKKDNPSNIFSAECKIKTLLGRKMNVLINTPKYLEEYEKWFHCGHDLYQRFVDRFEHHNYKGYTKCIRRSFNLSIVNSYLPHLYETPLTEPMPIMRVRRSINATDIKYIMNVVEEKKIDYMIELHDFTFYNNEEDSFNQSNNFFINEIKEGENPNVICEPMRSHWEMEKDMGVYINLVNKQKRELNRVIRKKLEVNCSVFTIDLKYNLLEHLNIPVIFIGINSSAKEENISNLASNIAREARKMNAA